MQKKCAILAGVMLLIAMIGMVYILNSTRLDYVGFNAEPTETIELREQEDAIEQTIVSRYDIQEVIIWVGSSVEEEVVCAIIQGEIIDATTGESLGVAICEVDTDLEEVEIHLDFGEALNTQFKTVVLVLTATDVGEGELVVLANQTQNEKLSCTVNGEIRTENIVFGIHANSMVQSVKYYCSWIVLLGSVLLINILLYRYNKDSYVAFIRKWTSKDTYLVILKKIWNHRRRIYWVLGEFSVLALVEWYRATNVANQTFFIGKAVFYVAVLELVKLLVRSCRNVYTVEKVYLIISITIGALIACYFPSVSISWDELIHYDRTIQICEYFGMSTSAADEAKMVSFVNELTVFEILENNEWLNEIDEIETVVAEREVANVYQLVGYIPFTIGMLLGELLQLSFTWTVALSKLMNVIACSVIIYYAIKKVKTGKLLLAAIALLPTNMFLMGVFSYDVWVTAWLMLGIAYIISILEEPNKQVTTKDIAMILFSFFIGLGPKAIYFPLILVALIIPKSRFQSDRAYKKFVILVGVVTAVVFADVIMANTSSAIEGDSRGGSDISGKDQIIYILTNPIEYSKTLLSFMGSYFRISNIGFNARSYAYLGTINYSNWYLIALGCATFIDKQEEDKYIGTWKVRIVTWGMVFATMSLAMTALYIAFTAVGATTISGFQARYMIPILYPTLLLMPKVRLGKYVKKELYVSILFGIMSFVSLAGIWFVFSNYVL